MPLKPVELLAPPLESIGQGQNALYFSPPSPAWHCALSRRGEWLAACYGAPKPCLRIWKEDSGQWTLHSTLCGIHQRTIRCVAFAPLSSSFILGASSFDGSVSIWEFRKESDKWECTTQLEGHENEVKGIAWNSTGSLLATCGRDKSVWLWETFLEGSIGGSSDNEFECIAVLNGHEGDVKVVCFAPSYEQWGDGDEILLSAGYDDTIKIWAEEAGDWYCAASVGDIHSDTIWSFALAPGGGRLVSASADGSISILKRYHASTELKKPTWKCVAKLPGAHASTVYSVAYAPAQVGHGRVVSAGGDNRIQIYRETSKSTSDQPLFSLEAAVSTPHGDVNCVCWHPVNGSLLFSAGDDGCIRLWYFDS